MVVQTENITAPGDAILSSIPDVANVINNADGKIAQSIENKTYYWAYIVVLLWLLRLSQVYWLLG